MSQHDYLLQFFQYEYLPAHLQEVARVFCEVAYEILSLPQNPERTMALRKLLESRDCALRCMMFTDIPE